MVVQARYAAGDGVLIGAGTHWVLVTDPGDEAVVAALWRTVARARPGDATVVAQVLALLERAFGGEPPALAMVDLSSPAGTSTSRGSGRVVVDGPRRVLSLSSAPAGAAQGSVQVLKPLLGGVVAADRAEVSPLGTRVAPSPQQATETARPHGLIDGIPAEVLAARGPDGPPPPRPRPTPAATEPQDTSDPGVRPAGRIDEGGHTTIRPPVRSEARTRAADADTGADADAGDTVHRAAPAHLQAATRDTVLAVSCPAGHLTPPTLPQCRLCHQRVAPQEPRRVPRPTLGGLRLPTGEVVPLDRGVVLGRRPGPVDGSHDWPHLVHLPPDHAYVSRMHLQVELDGWHVVARDLGSRGGTLLTVPGREPQWMRAGEAYVLEHGHVLDLAEAYEVRLEAGTVGQR